MSRFTCSLCGQPLNQEAIGEPCARCRLATSIANEEDAIRGKLQLAAPIDYADSPQPVRRPHGRSRIETQRRRHQTSFLALFIFWLLILLGLPLIIAWLLQRFA
jgi:hypothetical protein